MSNLKELNSTDLMEFGKYKGKTIESVDPAYFDWLIAQSWFIHYVQLYRYIIKNFTAEEVSDTKGTEDTPW
jgi:hypothetical protein